MGTQTQSDITSSATVSAVIRQGHSPVQDSARQGSPTPVIQEETVAPSFKVRAEVYLAIDSESDAVSVKQGQTQAPTRMNLGT